MAGIRRVGKKGIEWQRAKVKLIEIYKKKGIVRCEISNSRFALSFHHIDKRSSQKAVHTFEGTRLLSQEWHDFCEYNKEANEVLRKKPRGFDIAYYQAFKNMSNKRKKKSKKADWQQEHNCKKCKGVTRHYLCHLCGKVSI